MRRAPGWAAAILLLAIVGCGSNGALGADAGPQADAAAQDAGGQQDALPPPTTVDYLIVAADPLMDAAGRYRDFRVASGLQVALAGTGDIIGAAGTAEEAAAAVRAFVRGYYDVRDPSRPLFLLLIGDARPGTPLAATVPAMEVAGVTTDNGYADMDDDGIPDLAVGRIPTSSAADVDAVREKVARYESDYTVGLHNRRINLFASTSGFGEPIDSMIEGMVFQEADQVSSDFDISMTYAKQTSPYVYVPQEFSDEVYERINEGSLLTTYVGHGNTDAFAPLEWSGTYYPILDVTQLAKVAVQNKAPILCLIACLLGAFDGASDSLSERLLRIPDGPVAVLSSTEVSDPYPNAIIIHEFGYELTAARPATLGEAFAEAKRRMITNDDAMRQTIDQFASFQYSPAQMEALKQSHLSMYTLFGDPALRLAYPRNVAAVTVPSENVAPGAELAVSATFAGPTDGQALVTLESQRSVILGTITTVPADDDPTRDDVIRQNYAAANDKVAVSSTVTFTGGAFATTLTVPASLPAGSYRVKVYADDGTTDAVGSASVTIGN